MRRRARDLSDSQLVHEMTSLLLDHREQGWLAVDQERRWKSLVDELLRRDKVRLPECYCEECWPYTAAGRQF